jgi:hypothetical protein
MSKDLPRLRFRLLLALAGTCAPFLVLEAQTGSLILPELVLTEGATTDLFVQAEHDFSLSSFSISIKYDPAALRVLENGITATGTDVEGLDFFEGQHSAELGQIAYGGVLDFSLGDGVLPPPEAGAPPHTLARIMIENIAPVGTVTEILFVDQLQWPTIPPSKNSLVSVTSETIVPSYVNGSITTGGLMADAGEDQTVEEGTRVTLMGSGSSPGSGAALTFAWAQLTTVAIENPVGANSATFEFTAPPIPAGGENQAMEFELTVSDGTNTTTDRVSVMSINVVTLTVDAGGDQTANEAARVTLAGSASSPRGPGALVYAWRQLSGQAVQGPSGADSPSYAFNLPFVDADETLEFELEVTDGLDTLTDTVAVTVMNAGDETLEVDAGAGAMATENSPVTLSGTAVSSIPGATITFAWRQLTDVPLQNETGADSATYQFTVPPIDGDQTIELELEATDGVKTATDTVTVTALDVDIRRPSLTPTHGETPTFFEDGRRAIAFAGQVGWQSVAENGVWRRVAFQTRGQANAFERLEGATLYLDSDGDGSVTGADSELGRIDAFASDDDMLAFDVDRTLTDGQQEQFLLVVDIVAEEAPPEADPAPEEAAFFFPLAALVMFLLGGFALRRAGRAALRTGAVRVVLTAVFAALVGLPLACSGGSSSSRRAPATPTEPQVEFAVTSLEVVGEDTGVAVPATGVPATGPTITFEDDASE